jgi:hypothetical protein
VLIKNAVFTSRNFPAYTYGGNTWPWVWPINNAIGVRAGLKDATTTGSGLRPTDYDAPYYIDQAASGRPTWLNISPTNAGATAYANAGIYLKDNGSTSGSGSSAIYREIYVGVWSASNEDLVLFDNLNYGIDAVGTNLTVRNCAFMNMNWRNLLNLGVTATIFAIDVDSKSLFSSLPHETTNTVTNRRVKFFNKFFIFNFFKVSSKI